ncbi:MAG: outer membrane protein assembly factor BamA [Flavobacterium sp.]|nr:MAG: outer membrane protein assembly factor BamA [Flavobacterium sp.]
MRLSLVIKKENEDSEKQVNKLNNFLVLNKSIQFFFTILFFGSISQGKAQDRVPFDQGTPYILADINVTGKISYNQQTVITFTGLEKGQRITVPGEEISNAIKKLGKLGLFSDIDFYVNKVEGDSVFLELNINELPKLSEVKITGVKKSKTEALIKDNSLTKGKIVNENLVTTTKNYIENKYKKDGFFNTKVNITTIPDTTSGNEVKMLVTIDKGQKVKIKTIDFTGNEKFTDRKLRKAMSNTKIINPIRIFKRSKYIKEKYEEDLVSVISKYKEKGYRDARIISDSVIYDKEKNKIAIKINLEEGKKYYFGDIKFLGNTIYTDRGLSTMLGIKKGDVYNGVLLEKRIADKTKPDGDDITNLYQNNGYLFSQINAVEVRTVNDTIDFEIRILEGPLAYFNKITVTGNDKTNDEVIYRELRTKPGQKYSKEDLIRSIREIGAMGFFDPEAINPAFKNVDPAAGTVDIEWQLVEKGSSQIELQGGYGGGGFIGTLGLSFNNFSARNIFNKDAYKPLPMGDGQKVALRLQGSSYFQTYSLSFSEPWFGGTVGLTRNNKGTNPIFPMYGSEFSITAKLTPPYSLWNNIDYNALENEKDYKLRYSGAAGTFDVNGRQIVPGDLIKTSGTGYEVVDEVNFADADVDKGKVDQKKFNWLEYYKIKMKADWYTKIYDKLVLRSLVEFGYLGNYNSERGDVPFERFFLGGDGLANFALDGREVIQLRGYPNQSLTPFDSTGSQNGATIYNKFSLELRYPLTLKQQASIYVLTFFEAGAAYTGFKDYNPFQLQRSAGFGLRVFMPAFGLLGIDFAHGFDALPGATQKNGWETHFIIGQQF